MNKRYNDQLSDASLQPGERSTPASLLVIRREISQRLSSKTYRIVIVLMIVIAMAPAIIPKFIHHSHSVSSLTIASTSAGAKELSAITSSAEKISGIKVRIAIEPTARTVYNSVRGGEATIGYTNSELILNKALASKLTPSEVKAVGTLGQGIEVERVLSATTLRGQSTHMVSEILSPKTVKVIYITSDTSPRTTSKAAQPINWFLVMGEDIIMFALISGYSGWVLTGVIEEKSSRVIEMLLSAIDARTFLFGKVVGIATAALVQATVPVAAMILTSLAIGTRLPEDASVEAIALWLIWLLIGFSFYCGVTALTGSLVSTVEDAQTIGVVVLIPVLTSTIVGIFAVAYPGGIILKILAYLPLISSFLVPAYWMSGQMGIYQVLASAAVNILCTYLIYYYLVAKVYEATVFNRGARLRVRAATKLVTSSPH